MPSLLPGFHYDIFVSYRQKDNKGSHWVSEFVSALKTELEATFKEDISIYFDENPHDGLLETHDVGESLKEKLKCLVFIPILSHTYCDPKSYAWEHEFCAFIRQASTDLVGLKVHLSNGNVASRILPIRIHDLEPADIEQVETRTEGPLRPIDFLFKTPGVNRPLRPDDTRSDNNNKTVYRDQINKVANSIWELIHATTEPVRIDGPKGHKNSENKVKVKRISKRNIYVALLLAVLFTGIVLSYLYRSQGDGQTNNKISIAIIPFRNQTSNNKLDGYSFGIASEIRTKLSMSNHFDFITSDQATLKYLDSKESPMEIARELGVDYLLFGRFYELGDKLKITAELADGKTNKSLWSLPPYETSVSSLAELFNVQASISQKVLDWFSVPDIVESTPPTQNLEAYDYYLMGRDLNMTDSEREEYFAKAVALDSNFLAAQVELFNAVAYHYWNYGNDNIRRTELKPFIDRIERISADSWETNVARGYYYYWGLKDYSKGLAFFNKALEINPQSEDALTLIAAINRRRLHSEEAQKYFLKSMAINPRATSNYTDLTFTLWENGNLHDAFKSVALGRRMGMDKMWGLQLTVALARDSDNLQLVPDDMRSYFPGVYYSALAKSRRDWNALNRIADTASYFNTLDRLSDHAYASFGLSRTDSAKYYALQEIAEEKKLGIHNSREFMMVILGKPADAIKYYVDSAESISPSHSNNNIRNICAYQIDKIILLAFAGKYAEATQAVSDLNKQYPAWGAYYSLFHDFRLDRIKRDYPPFVEALKNIKLPQKLNLHGKLDKMPVAPR